MPELSYDALTNLLIFLVGVPTLVLQTVDQEIRRVIVRRLVRDTLTPAMVALIVIAVGLAEQAALPANPEGTPTPLIALGSIAFIPNRGNIALVVMGVLAGLSGYASWIAIQRYGRRDVVIGQLKSESVQYLFASPRWTTRLKLGIYQAIEFLAQRLPNQPRWMTTLKRRALRWVEPTLTQFRNQPRLMAKPLEDLIELGEQSAPGENKEWVLCALGDLVEQVAQHRQYQGDSLEILTTKLVDVLTSAAQPGTARNFSTAAGILGNIVTIASKTQHTVDLMYAIRALGYLGRTALDRVSASMEIELTLLNCVGSLGLAANLCPEATNQASEELFKLGMVLLKNNQPFIAAYTLDTMLTLISANPQASGELVHDTLGLMAHFWTDSSTAKQHVKDKLDALKPQLALDMPAALGEARMHCMRTTYFQTADNLEKMMQEIAGPN